MRTYTDDDVATILTAEAARKRDPNVQRTGTGAPKPNTRFLQHLLKETDSHNAALLARERREARARQDRLRQEQQDSRRGGGERASKRRRIGEADRSDRKRPRPRSRSRSKSPMSTRRRGDRSKDPKRHRRRRSVDDEERSRRNGHDRRRKSRSRDRHKESKGDKSRASHHRRRRSESVSDEQSEHVSRNRKSKSEKQSRTTSTKGTPHRSSEHLVVRGGSVDNHSDSDPLEDIVGPLPPPKPTMKGRGTFSQSTSNIDAHFNPEYDPSQDIEPNDAEDDWELALEAMRDREKWKQKGAERLRAAGFSEDQVQKWKRTTISKSRNEGDFEGDINNVKWAKKGEGREWDRGKVVDVDGDFVGVETGWGRLKDT